MQADHWLALNDARKARKRLLQAGFLPIPTVGKKALIRGWSDLVATEAIIDDWFYSQPEAFNTGIVTRTTPAVDIDVYDPDVADAIEALLWEVIGTRGMIRFGEPPKRAALFRTETPFGKISTPVFTSPTNRQRHRVEVLCSGQQIVVFGTHPDTGKPYCWHGGQPGDVARAALPELTEAVAREFVAKAIAVMRSQGWIEDAPSGASGGCAEARPHTPHTPYAPYGARPQSTRNLRKRTTHLLRLVEDARPTTRNETLFWVACRFGEMIDEGKLTRPIAEQLLVSAACLCGLVREDGIDRVGKTIASGLAKGLAAGRPENDGAASVQAILNKPIDEITEQQGPDEGTG